MQRRPRLGTPPFFLGIGIALTSTNKWFSRCTFGRRTWLPILAFGMACLVLWLWQYAAFPRSSDYQEIIRTADRVEVRAFIINNESGGTDFLVLSDPTDLAMLADSLRVTGIWIPVDDLIANSHRIRVIGEGGTTDIVIRGFTRIRSGIWHAPIDESLMTTINDLAQKHESKIPDWVAMTARKKEKAGGGQETEEEPGE